jgi:hypothetical protein
MVSVKVPLPTQKQSASRSVDPDTVQRFVNAYEVVFQHVDSDAYYRAEAAAAQGYISADVPAGTTYNVLLLAGYNRTLLGAGYVGSANIEVGKPNVIEITVTPFPPQWDSRQSPTNGTKTVPLESGDAGYDADPDQNGTKEVPCVPGDPGYAVANEIWEHNDFVFTANLKAYTDAIAASETPTPTPLLINQAFRYVQVAPHIELDGGDVLNAEDIDLEEDTFTVEFNIAKFGPLWAAQQSSSNGDKSLGIAGYTVRIWPRYVEDSFKPISLVLDTTSTGVTAGSGDSFIVEDGSSPTATISFTNDPEKNSLPAYDVDGVLQFDLEYYAFGRTPTSSGLRTSRWIIRNGMYLPGEDTGADIDLSIKDYSGKGTEAGSFVVVRFGRGSESASTTMIYTSY